MQYEADRSIKTDRGPIARDFDRLDAERLDSLRIIDRCAELCKPWYMSRRYRGYERNDRLRQAYQSSLTHAINHLTGITAIAFFNPGGMWQRLSVKPHIRFDPTISPQALIDIENELRIREFTYQSLLESAHFEQRSVGGRIRRPLHDVTFFAAKIRAIDQIFVTGEVLEHLDDDFRLRAFAREQYVTERDSNGDVLRHLICEEIDPLGLSPKHFALTGLDREQVSEKRGSERLVAMHTLVEYQPRSGKWNVSQEVNAKIINEFSDPISAYMCSGLELGPNDDYHHGLVEMYKGDAESINELTKRVLDAAGFMSKMVPVIDYSAEVSEEDLARESGVPVRCRVEGGQAMDMGLLTTQKSADLSFANAVKDSMENRLAKAMLVGSDAVRRSERTTAYEVQNVLLAELQGVHGGIMARMQPGQQNQLIRRVDWQAKKQGLIRPLGKNEGKLIEYGFLTGPAALSREGEYQKLKEFVLDLGMLSQANPELLRRLDFGVIARRMAALKEFYTGGVLKSEEQLAKEQAEQLAMLAAQKGVEAVGNAAEANMTAQAQ